VIQVQLNVRNADRQRFVSWPENTQTGKISAGSMTKAGSSMGFCVPNVLSIRPVVVSKTKRKMIMFKTKEELETLIAEKKKELEALEKAPEVSRGVKKLADNKYVAMAWRFKLGEFSTEEEAATAYNNHVRQKFTFPIYNNKGEEVGLVTEYDVTPTEEMREEIQENPNAALYETYYPQTTSEEQPTEVEPNVQETIQKLISIE
jgi:hypothetical protein